ncbi:hypothetical protein ES708_27020 [subsurface metagenome]
MRITHKSKLFGFLVLSLEPDVYIDQEEKELLEEVTGDIAFGLYSIELEEQHKEAEEKYRTLYETIKEGIDFCDMEGNILDANQAFLDMLGYSIEEIKRLTYQKITPKKWHEVDTDILKNQIITRGYSKEFEKEFIKKDGTLLPIAIIAWLLKDKQGKPVGMWGIIRDITERKQVEEELRESEEKFKNLAEESPNMIFINQRGRVVYVNKKCQELIGYEREEFYSPDFDFMRLVAPEYKDLAKEHFGRHSSGEEVTPHEYTLITKVGERIELILTTKLINYQGETAILGILTDITERKKAEERLKKTFNASIDIISKIIEVKDPYTAGHQQRVSQLATAIAKELNFSKDKIEGVRIASLIHDIGKIGIPTEILSKSIILTDVEFNLVKDHSQIGYNILKSIDFSYPVDQIVLQHHEKLNGSGYPQGLKGDKILLEAKIIGVADVVEAMSSHRPYRPALGVDKALEEISQNKGILYDPEVVNVCIKLFKEKGFKFK